MWFTHLGTSPSPFISPSIALLHTYMPPKNDHRKNQHDRDLIEQAAKLQRAKVQFIKYVKRWEVEMEEERKEGNTVYQFNVYLD